MSTSLILRDGRWHGVFYNQAKAVMVVLLSIGKNFDRTDLPRGAAALGEGPCTFVLSRTSPRSLPFHQESGPPMAGMAVGVS